MNYITGVFHDLTNRRRSSGYFSFAAAVAVCILFSLNALAAEQMTAPATKPVPPPLPAPPAGIQVADIAAQATEVSKQLSNLISSTAPTARIESIANSLPGLSKTLEGQIAATNAALVGEPTLETIQTLQQQWQGYQLQTTPWLNVLTQQASKLQDGLNQLANLEKTWNTTRTSARAAGVPTPILEQVDATLTAISTAQTKLEAERTPILDLQSRVAQEVTKCTTALTQIAQFQEKAVAGIFTRGAPPIWQTDVGSDAINAQLAHMRKVSEARWSDLLSYARQPGEGSRHHAALFIVLALLFSTARRTIDRLTPSSASESSVLLVLQRPFSAALATTLLVATSPFSQLSTPVRQILTIVALAPFLRVAQPVVSPSVAALSYAVCMLFALDIVRQFYSGIQVVGQAILIVETLLAIIVLFRMRGHYRQIVVEKAESSRLIILKLARFILIATLIIALLAAALGYLRLARLLTPGIFVGGVLALAAFANLQVFGAMVAVAFRIWPLRLLQMVEHHRDFLIRRTYILLVWMTVLAWLARYLAYLGLLNPVWSAGHAVLAAKMVRGTISISLGNILEFLLTVTFAYLLSRFIRFALQEDVYPRIHLAPGLSYAVSSLLNYILLALGFVAGLGVLGVDFSRVSILAGAFGVGIGFGLQSIVNNFVSGLILLFERPIHVGDMVQVADHQGRVQRIGIRASIIRTLHGAEIIVPNAQLISEQVTNWTLSDQLRRIDLPVGVSYGTAPKMMIELLEGAARAHARVLTNPAPRALFMGYGDSSINFELRAWCEYTVWQQVHSDLTVAVYDALYAAGITIPFPQRDVHLISVPAAGDKDAPVEPLSIVKKSDSREG